MVHAGTFVLRIHSFPFLTGDFFSPFISALSLVNGEGQSGINWFSQNNDKFLRSGKFWKGKFIYQFLQLTDFHAVCLTPSFFTNVQAGKCLKPSVVPAQLG